MGSPGGGGWGDPLARDPALVLRDVRDEVVSLEAARKMYGVVLKEDASAVDQAATKALRSQRVDSEAGA
jgi:N-methylhydantoinase B